MLYGSEAWCLNEKEVAILRTERAMLRAMCGVKLMDRLLRLKWRRRRMHCDGLGKF